MIHNCVLLFSDSCSRVPCLSWTVKLSAVLPSEKSISSHKCFGFPSYLCIWTLSNNDCMILRSIFSHRGQLNDLYAAITEYSNTHWCSRRKKHALRARAWKLLIRMKMCIFLVLHKYQIFPFSTDLQKLQKIVTCFPEDKLSYIYSDLQIQKVS